jgi:hypothetical protein
MMFRLCVLALITCLLTCPAFEVTRNINTGLPPVEKVVLFAKNKPHDHIICTDAENCRIAFDVDGAMTIQYSGNKESQPKIAWKVGEGRPESFDVANYTFLIITCRIEGVLREDRGNGKMTESRGDNLWIGPSVYNVAGDRVGGIGLAELAEDGKTPAQTTVLRVPLTLFARSPVDNQHVNAIGFPWGAARKNQNRDFRLVIDRIALAD